MDMISMHSRAVSGPDDVANPTTGYLVWRLSTKWRAAVDKAVGPLGLTHAQYALLASLYGLTRAGARPSQRELADFSCLEPMFVSKLARALQHGGLLERTGNPVDPRAVQLALTDRGVDIVVQAIGKVAALHDELLAPLGGTASARHGQLVEALQTLLRETPNSTRGDEL
jgi:DNA-binding MarR family transcriptional regulator